MILGLSIHGMLLHYYGRMIREYKNFLNISYFQEISNLVCGNEFAWFYNENISYKNSNNNINEHGFSHWIVHPNRPDGTPMYQDYFMPLLLMIKDCVKRNKIIRARVDMTMVATEKFVHNYHKDFEQENIAAILYINETDGETIILENETEKIIKPEVNKLVTFDGNISHTGCSPLKYKRRILINSNYE